MWRRRFYIYINIIDYGSANFSWEDPRLFSFPIALGLVPSNGSVPFGEVWEGTQSAGVINAMTYFAVVWCSAGDTVAHRVCRVGSVCEEIPEFVPCGVVADGFTLRVYVETRGWYASLLFDIQAFDVHRGYKVIKLLLHVVLFV